VSIEIYDRAGRRLDRRSFSMGPGVHRADVSVVNLPSGVYFARLTFGPASSMRKFVVLHR
jgi:hypothetical protein